MALRQQGTAEARVWRVSASRCVRAWGIGALIAALTACATDRAPDPVAAPEAASDPTTEGAENDSPESRTGETTTVPTVAHSVREFAEVPPEVPSGAVPEGAAGITGMVTSSDEAFSAAVEFDLDTDDREAVLAEVEPAIRAAGFEFVERLYDADRTQTLYSSPSGSLLTYTLTRTESGLRGAIVIGS